MVANPAIQGHIVFIVLIPLLMCIVNKSLITVILKYNIWFTLK
nr:MAG TPA: hypothetical protein [Caudoviricetes sp.]